MDDGAGFEMQVCTNINILQVVGDYKEGITYRLKLRTAFPVNTNWSDRSDESL